MKMNAEFPPTLQNKYLYREQHWEPLDVYIRFNEWWAHLKHSLIRQFVQREVSGLDFTKLIRPGLRQEVDTRIEE